MQHIKIELSRKMERDRRTERGELMKYFRERLNPGRRQEGLPPITMGRMGKLLEGIPTKDLYYLKSVCDKARNFSTTFWYQLNPEKYADAAKKKFAKNEKRSPGTDDQFL